MSDRSSIEWTDATWNPILGVRGKWSCVKVSPGCTNCYAEKMNIRFGGPRYTVGADDLRLDEKALTAPLRWRRPRRVFVCSMTDLFEERVPNEWIISVFDVMTKARQHTFQVLTKRAARMSTVLGPDGIGIYVARGPVPAPWPNIWLGVSIEDQDRLEERLPLLRRTPAWRRFVSAEPLLGALEADWKGIDWVIVGGESGPGARPMESAWARNIVANCRKAKVPVFVKQLGARPQFDERTEHADWLFTHIKDRKGGDPSEWPEDLRVREFPA